MCWCLLSRCNQQAVNYKTKIDTLFNRFDMPNSPGCAVAVVQNGKLVHKEGYGLANLEYDIPITPTSVFDIASVSKQFAGLAVSTLIQEGKINPDDDSFQISGDPVEMPLNTTFWGLILVCAAIALEPHFYFSFKNNSSNKDKSSS